MLSALLQDCCALPGVEAHTLLGPAIHHTLPATIHRTDPARGWLASFTDVLHRVDAVLIIAPEFERLLETLTLCAEQHAKQLIGCSAASVALTADKWACGRHLEKHGVPTPPCQEFRTSEIATLKPDFTYPLVLKPRDGAGSLATVRIDEPSSLPETFRLVRDENPGQEWILQPLAPGQPASVACIVHEKGVVALPAATQQISTNGRFHYCGGELPLLPRAGERAQRLAKRALTTISGLRGYVGVDLILGEAQDGRDDSVIEINPRITTSYLGLKALCQQNLLEAMVAACTAKPIPELTWNSGKRRFQADGSVSEVSHCS